MMSFCYQWLQLIYSTVCFSIFVRTGLTFSQFSQLQQAVWDIRLYCRVDVNVRVGVRHLAVKVKVSVRSYRMLYVRECPKKKIEVSMCAIVCILLSVEINVLLSLHMNSTLHVPTDTSSLFSTWVTQWLIMPTLPKMNALKISFSHLNIWLVFLIFIYSPFWAEHKNC